jgi:bifunctional DNase/RNase
MLDSRPSDAIALALRAGVPIYANSKALNGASSNQLPQ